MFCAGFWNVISNDFGERYRMFGKWFQKDLQKKIRVLVVIGRGFLCSVLHNILVVVLR